MAEQMIPNEENWDHTDLGKHIDLLTGYPFQSARYTDELASIPLLRGDNIVQGTLRWEDVKRWPKKTIEGLSEYFLQEGDVVIAMDRPWIEAGLKYACITKYDTPCLLVQRVARLRARSGLDQQFLRYLIGSAAFTNHILAVQTGTAVPHISPNQIKEYRFLLPPIAEQREIAHILGALDDKIEANRRMNATLEAIAQALFKSWFVDFDPVHAKAAGRQPEGMDAETAALFPDGFESSALGDIPRGWRVGTLGEITHINALSVTPDYPHKVIEYIDISSVREGRCIGATVYQLSEAPSRARRLVAHGDTIWSTVRPNLKSYLFIHNPKPNLVVSTGFAVLTPHRDAASFLYLWTTTDRFVDYLTKSADGSAYPAVRAERFATAPVFIPNEGILAAFEAQVGRLRDMCASNDSESGTLAELRDTLLPKLLSGEVRVNL